MKHPWFPFWPGDYLADTAHLSTLEHGAYLLLIFHYWINGGLPVDDEALARIARLPLKSWRAIRPTIEKFFEMPGWRHRRIEADLDKLGRVKIRRQVAGSIGGTRSAIARARGRRNPSNASRLLPAKRQARPKQN